MLEIRASPEFVPSRGREGGPVSLFLASGGCRQSSASLVLWKHQLLSAPRSQSLCACLPLSTFLLFSKETGPISLGLTPMLPFLLKYLCD